MLEAPIAKTNQYSVPPDSSQSVNWSTRFNSASELAAVLLRLGKSFDVLQLSTGQLQGHFAVVHLKDLSIFSIQSNQLLLLNGERGQDCITFSLETSGNHSDHKVFCQSIESHSLHGFKPDLKESHFQLTAGSTTVIAITSGKKFCRFLECCGEFELRDRLHTSNSLQLSAEYHSAIANSFYWHLNNPSNNQELRSLHTGEIFVLLLEALSSRNDQSFKPFEVAPRQQLVGELISWGFDNSTTPLKLDDVSNILFSSRRTLIQGCKENFQMGPMELLRLIRLEEVNHFLRSQDLRKALDLKNVGEVASYFGFTSRGHFSAAYQNHFGESPRQTLSKANMIHTM